VLAVVGRVREDVSLKAAGAQLSAVMSDLAREHAETLASRTIVALPIRDALVGNVKPILLSLLVAVGLLLAAMSANLALLMLTRYLERASELAMRTALGATRARILRQLFVESLALSIAGAVLAVAVGRIATRSLVAAIPDGVMISLPYLAKAAPDGRVVGIIAAVAVGLSIVFGIWPAVLVQDNKWQAGSARATVTRGNRRIRHTLVVTQIAVTVVLLVSSGLLITSFMNLITPQRQPDTEFPPPRQDLVVALPARARRRTILSERFLELLLRRVGLVACSFASCRRRLLFDDGTPLVCAGIGVGVVAAFVVSRSINAIPFGVANTDRRIYSGVAATVVISAVLTALRPASTATSVDPAAVMREL
jgi:hypothetical protein